MGAGPSCDPKGAGVAVSCCSLLGNEVSPLEHSRCWQFEGSRMGPFFLPKHVKGYFGDVILFVLLDIPFSSVQYSPLPFLLVKPHQTRSNFSGGQSCSSFTVRLTKE